MKKIILFAFLSVAVLFGRQNVYAQIALDHTYTSDLPDRYVKLSLSGLKYVYLKPDSLAPGYTNIKLFNPDYSLFKNISIPQFVGKRVAYIVYISETLFDTDSLIEYGIGYTDSGNPTVQALRICNENGVVLLERDTAQLIVSGATADYNSTGLIIFPDGTDTKLIVAKNYWAFPNRMIEIYSLPGQLACLECTDGLVNGLAQPPGMLSEESRSLLYPNPSDGNATIEFKLPKGINSGEIVLYKMDGSEVKRYRVDGTFGNLILNNSGLSAGTYMYQLIAGGKAVDAKRMIVIH